MVACQLIQSSVELRVVRQDAIVYEVVSTTLNVLDHVPFFAPGRVDEVGIYQYPALTEGVAHIVFRLELLNLVFSVLILSLSGNTVQSIPLPDILAKHTFTGADMLQEHVGVDPERSRGECRPGAVMCR
jgi:hypothetical protein